MYPDPFEQHLPWPSAADRLQSPGHPSAAAASAFDAAGAVAPSAIMAIITAKVMVKMQAAAVIAAGTAPAALSR